jgi:hypothetical protein
MKAGVRTALVEWDDATVDLLIRADALTPREIDDYTRTEIGAAITKLLDVSAQKAIQDGVIHLRVRPRARLADAQIRRVVAIAPHAPDRPRHRTVPAFGQGDDSLRNLSQKPIAIARLQRAGGIHDGGQFGIGEANRLRHWRLLGFAI